MLGSMSDEDSSAQRKTDRREKKVNVCGEKKKEKH